MSFLKLARALALSSHPVPSVAVTALGGGCAALAGVPVAQGLLVTGAVFTGQLSIGWSNDYLDAERDQAVRRTDKPVAKGEITPRLAGIAALVALAFTLALSMALGWPAGGAALIIVASGWAYNVGLKATAASWLPYAVAFGMLPAVATLSAEPPRWPDAWALAAGALLGVAAHLANVLPDLSDDAATGVRGLPHRIGATGTALGAAAVLLAASAVILLGPPGDPGVWPLASSVVAVGVTVMIVRLAFIAPSSRRIFLAIIAIAVLDLLAFAAAGVRL